jgi:ATP-binding cassette subfamily F protein uup
VALRGAALHAARKELARLETRLARIETATAAIHDQMAVAATDHQRLGQLTAQLAELAAEQGQVEESWMELAERLGD